MFSCVAGRETNIGGKEDSISESYECVALLINADIVVHCCVALVL